MALQNAEAIEAQEVEVREAAEAGGATFVGLQELPQALQDAIVNASASTWRRGVEQTEAAGHPGRATARLWAQLVLGQGGELPEGVAEFLELGS